ncbi:hypothetical protein ONA91_08065 [Micromonospora sp. DR5-3]|uniref:golvesin C-terminal-like domain-containing protein n=1 Tax=unclassified Micromonospora TaxID=2617518 RepID=UPI0011D3AA54|nr:MULTISPECIES: TIM-barrel domain-containing protein [unclassified Micromonospora]MCW3814412.1 hypothetical protein [Micromonospora sp. DR5-3]TYC19696.1 hypothetical protein FXF52_35195 [Micromonospora sp. MP36]
MAARPRPRLLLAFITALLAPLTILTAPSPAAAAETLIVTPSTPGAYAETGTWANARDPGYAGSLSRYSRTPGSTATWTAVAPASARYDLAVYYAASVDNAKAEYAWTGGPDTPTVVNQATGGNGWRTIGSTYLDQGQTFSLTVTATAGPAVTTPNLNVITRANAVRLLEVAGDGGEPAADCGTDDSVAPNVDAPEQRFPAYRLAQHDTIVSVAGDHWSMSIDRRGFKYGFDVDGAPAAAPHPTAGLELAATDGSVCDAVAATLTAADESSVRFAVTFSNGRTADVAVAPAEHSVNLRITAGDPRTGTVRAQLAGGMSPAYGLGDLGGYRTDLDAYGIKNLDYYAQNSAGTTNQRFVSTFTVFPGRKLAQVALSNGRLAVEVDDAATLLGVNGPAMSGLHYFFGDMPTIYQRYAEVRRSAGYHDAKPDYTLFGVGYESYGALGYNTNQRTITDSVTTYLDKGFPLSWVVTGSGFWPYGSGSAQGTTSSFGLWGAKYPDPDAYKKFFHDHGISLLLGARQSFRALPADGGTYDPALDGDGTAVGIERGYFIKDANGKPRVFRPVSFPNTAMYLIDPDNAEAVKWFVARSREWGADGYKEDHMYDATANGYANNALVNPVNEGLNDDGALMMVRNSAFSVAGSILRINDTDYNQGPKDRDRTVVNGLAYAASGQPNFYPDIVGGRIISDLETNTSKQRYLTRNAMMAAMSPAMSFGNEPWRMNDPVLVEATLKAAQWHAEYQPYIYSAAVTAYETGYPSTATPLPVAFPEDPQVRDLASAPTKQYEWMLGPSLLVAPLYGSDTDTAMARDVYLPAGDWMDIETGTRFSGPTTLTDYQQPFGKIPAFVGGTGILVHDPGARDPGDDVAAGGVRASVYPVAAPGATLSYTASDGTTRSRITAKNTSWSADDIVVRDSSGADVAFTTDPVTRAIQFPIKAGLDYVVSDAGAPEWGVTVIDLKTAGPMATDRALPVRFALVDGTGTPASDRIASLTQVTPDGTERELGFELDDQHRVHTVLTTQAGVPGTYVLVMKAADGRRLAHLNLRVT